MNDNILYHALARPRAPRPDPPFPLVSSASFGSARSRPHEPSSRMDGHPFGPTLMFGSPLSVPQLARQLTVTLDETEWIIKGIDQGRINPLGTWKGFFYYYELQTEGAN